MVVEPAASGSKSPPTPAGKVCGLLLGAESPSRHSSAKWGEGREGAEAGLSAGPASA